MRLIHGVLKHLKTIAIPWIWLFFNYFQCFFKENNVKIFTAISYICQLSITKLIREFLLSAFPVLLSFENNAGPKLVILKRECTSTHWSR